MDMTAFDQAIDDDTRKQLRAADLELALALEKLVKRGGSTSIKPPSQQVLDPAYITDVSLLFGLLAAADHLRALGKLMTESRVTLATESVSRGVIEALARACWIAQADDASAAAARTLSLLRRDASVSSTSSIYQARTMADELSSEDYISQLDDVLAMLGGKVKVPSLTDLSTSLLEAAFPTMDGRRKYAELSAIAHGSAAAIGPYSTKEGRLQLPRLIALNTMGAVIGCADRGVRVVVATPTKIFREDAVQEIWEPAIARVAPIVDSLRGRDIPG